MRRSTPRDSLWNQNFGHLGTGLPYAIGAQLVVGNKRRVVLVTGDSAFLFHTTELETAVRKNLPVVCIVGCDYAWGLEVRGYRAPCSARSRRRRRRTGASSCGSTRSPRASARTASTSSGRRISAPAIARALASGKPAVVQVVIDGVGECCRHPWSPGIQQMVRRLHVTDRLPVIVERRRWQAA